MKVESSDLGECHDKAHDEENVPPFAALASNPTHSNDDPLEILHWGEGALVRGTMYELNTGGEGALAMYELNTWTVYGL